MATFYEEMQELASELLHGDEFGQSKTGHVINILTRTEVEGASRLEEPTVTWTPTQVNATSRGVTAKRDGQSLFERADLKVTIEGYGNTAPDLKDKIEINGTEYSIVEVQPTSNDGTIAAFYVYVKR